MVGKLLLQSQLLPIESVSLARFVVNTASPQRRFHDPILESPPRSIRHKQYDFQEHTQRYKSTKVGGRLTELLQVFHGVNRSLEAHVNATSSISYELCQWDAVFEDACTSQATRKWIENVIEDGQDFYFVVGFRTFVDPRAYESIAKSSIKGGEMQLPASAVFEANFPGVAVGGVLDPGVDGSTTRARQNLRSFAGDGEMVYAVQYCKVSFKWYSSRKLDTAFLGKTRWQVHWGVRALEEIAEDDVIEAVVEEDKLEPSCVGDYITLD
ncbi:MAG: hypothetical protein LQ351_003609 [Letrouitia transgressa]|nr:MAG: hypothetical protein LQ351_003609 [Letrouitia transgressa]